MQMQGVSYQVDITSHKAFNVGIYDATSPRRKRSV